MTERKELRKEVETAHDAWEKKIKVVLNLFILKKEFTTTINIYRYQNKYKIDNNLIFWFNTPINKFNNCTMRFIYLLLYYTTAKNMHNSMHNSGSYDGIMTLSHILLSQRILMELCMELWNWRVLWRNYDFFLELCTELWRNHENRIMHYSDNA